MRNLLKYSPMKLREYDGLCTPAGPSFKDSQKISLDLLGAQLTFKAPRHSPDFSGMEQKKVISSTYQLEGRDFHEDVMPSQSWKMSELMYRDWAFYGPWFTGYMASLDCSLNAVHLSNESTVSFFHPKVFETAVGGYLTAQLGHKVHRDRALWQGPLGWSPVDDFPVPAARFHIESPGLNMGCISYFMFPVSSQKMICMSFRAMQHCPGSKAVRDAKISLDPLIELVDEIINSVQLTLPPEQEKIINEIKSTAPGLSVASEFAPLKWPALVADDGLAIIESEGENLNLSSTG